MSTAKWILDPTHSEVHFKVKHMMVSTVTGHFKTFSATVTTENDDFAHAKIHFTADVESISTNNDQRDGHLKTGDFFDTANHPQIIFDGDRMEKTGDDSYKLHGTLTMRGVSKPFTFTVEHGGVMQDPWGNTRAGFEISGKVNRKDFGVSFSMVTETGGVMLSDEVKLSANMEFTKEAIAQTA